MSGGAHAARHGDAFSRFVIPTVRVKQLGPSIVNDIYLTYPVDLSSLSPTLPASRQFPRSTIFQVTNVDVLSFLSYPVVTNDTS